MSWMKTYMQFFCALKGRLAGSVFGVLVLCGALSIVFSVAVILCSNANTSTKNAAVRNTTEDQESRLVNSVVSEEKMVALTFDDGPGYKTTMQLLEGLKERDVHATFFLVGEKIEERQSVVERMKEDGHLIGNHTYSHVQLDSINMPCAQNEIEKTNQIIEDITGICPKYIRPPYGAWNDELEEAINMSAVLWTLDTSDWNTRDVRQIVEYVVSEVESGDIILMHDIYDTSVAAALEIVDELKQRGYVFVTVDELLLD